LLFAEVRYVRAGEDLQAALNSARAGDEIRLAPETTFSGNFVLPVKEGSSAITVRTDLPDNTVPGPRQRVTPATAVHLAKIVSPNSGAAIRTAPGAAHWRLMLLEIPSTKDGYGDIIQLGDGSEDQTQLSQVPSDLVLDRLYIHGDPVQGQKRGVALNSGATTIRNCYISDIKAVGVDSQAIGGWNGPGPFTIENNYLEATGEVVLLGGADPAIPNLVSSDVIVRNNHLTRPMAWRDGVVPAPANVAATGVASGSLPAGVYAYRVVARRPAGQGTIANSLATAEVTAVASSGAVRVTWDAVPGATDYSVYARNAANVTQFWTVTDPSFLHNSMTGKSGKPPTTATQWQVKNLFELKNARRVRIEYNLFENNWLAAQPGYTILFTPRNQGGKCPWCVIEQVEFSHNIVRHVSGGFNIAGYDSENSSQQTTAVTIQDNYVYDVTTTLGGGGWPFLIGDAPKDVVIDHNTLDFNGTTLLYAYGGTAAAPRPIPGFKFTNNAARHGTYGVNGADASTGTLTFQMYFPSVVFTGNWLSGGTSSKYPAGNRFEEPFDPTHTGNAGADVARLLRMVESIKSGLMTLAPDPPQGLQVISSR
jgi:hypothetical protein